MSNKKSMITIRWQLVACTRDGLDSFGVMEDQEIPSLIMYIVLVLGGE